jgi:hypothetical protein
MKISIALHKRPEWFFYPAWIILTCVCIPLAYLLDLLSLRIITHFVGDYLVVNGVQHITEDYLGLYPFVPLAGLLTGGIQFGLLRCYLPRMGWWVLATTGGWLLGAFILLIPGWLGLEIITNNIILIFSVMGFSIGLAQWPVLRPHLPRSGWWIGANLAGWGLLALITTGNSIGQFGLFTLGFLPACVTATALVFLTNQN